MGRLPSESAIPSRFALPGDVSVDAHNELPEGNGERVNSAEIICRDYASKAN